MRLVRFQLEQALSDVSSVLDFVDRKRNDDDKFEDWHYELLDLKLRLQDMVKNVDMLE